MKVQLQGVFSKVSHQLEAVDGSDAGIRPMGNMDRLGDDQEFCAVRM